LPMRVRKSLSSGVCARAGVFFTFLRGIDIAFSHGDLQRRDSTRHVAPLHRRPYCTAAFPRCSCGSYAVENGQYRASARRRGTACGYGAFSSITPSCGGRCFVLSAAHGPAPRRGHFVVPLCRLDRNFSTAGVSAKRVLIPPGHTSCGSFQTVLIM
jgi:hypothetical protein